MRLLTKVNKWLALVLGISLLFCAFPFSALAVPYFAIGDLVWNDLNGDGVQGMGEPGIEGVTINLLGPGGGTPSQTTDSNGNYQFLVPHVGDYTVTVDLSTVPSAFPFPTTPTSYIIPFVSGGINSSADFGFSQNPPIPEPSTMLLFGSGLAGLGWWRYWKQKTS